MSQTPRSRQPHLFTRISKRIALTLGCVASLATCIPASAQMQIVPQITTIAGNGTFGNSGDGGPATSAQFNSPSYSAMDKAGNVYISDGASHVVRRVDAVTGVITTVAGVGTSGYSGDGGPATSAMLNVPYGVAVDSNGNLYIADSGNLRIRMVAAGTGIITTVLPITANGLIFDSTDNLYISDTARYIRKMAAGTTTTTIIAGNGSSTVSGDGGPATSAGLGTVPHLALDSLGNVYFPSGSGLALTRIRMVNATTGIITTVAGNGTSGDSGDGGLATSAQFKVGSGVAVDPAGNLYIADNSSRKVRKVSNGIITTIAGNGLSGNTGDGGPATLASLVPIRMATDASGNVYVADITSRVLRKLTFASNFGATNIGTSSATQTLYLQVTADETITSITVPQSLAGKQEYAIGTITGCTVDGVTTNPAGTVCEVPITFTPAYPGRRWVPLQVVTSTGNINFGLKGVGVGPLASFTPGIISTFAGTGTTGYSGDGGPATSAQISQDAHSVVDSSGNLYFRDGSHIRKVDGTTGTISTVLTANNLTAFAMDPAGNIYIGGISVVSKRDAATGVTSVFAGTGTQGHTGDGGPATSARIYSATAMAFDSLGNAYIVEGGHLDVRKVAAGSGIISTYAGTGGPGNGGDGGPATSATFTNPTELAFDSKDNLYLVDQGPGVVRKIDARTGIITRVAGNGTSGYSGDGGPATSAQLNAPQQIFLDAADNLYIADYNNQRIRRVSAATGIITTIAGNGTKGSTGDGGLATAAQIMNPEGLAFDGVSSLYIGEFQSYRIRKVDVSTTQLSYPTVAVAGTADTADNPKSAIVSNIGNADLITSTPSSGNNPVISADFGFDESSTCPQLGSSSTEQILSSAAECTLAIDFVPTHVGNITGSAVLINNSLNIAGATQTIQLSGTASDGTTSTTVTSSANPAPYGQLVTFTATVAVSGATPTGTVQFSIDGITVGIPVTLSNGVATYATSTLTSGAHTVVAAYTPDTGIFKASNGSLNQTVSGLITRIVGAPTPNPSMYGQLVTIAVTVAPTSGTLTPTGTIRLTAAGGLDFGTVPLTNGTVTLTTSTLAVGKYTFNAFYQSDSPNFQNALGSIPQFPVRMVVNPVSTTTTVTSSLNPSPYTQSVTFTAQVAPTVGGAQPTGAVQFVVDGINSGSPVTLSAGKASFAISTLALGLHAISATYTPDSGNFTGSNGSLGQRVGAVASSTTALTVAPGTVMYSDTATLTAVVAPAFATGTVSFYEGTTLLGTASLDNTATAVLPISTLNAGVHNITAKYNGDPAVPANTSNTAQLTVTKRTAPGGGAAITVTVNNASRTTTQSNPPFTYSAAGQLVNGDTYATAISGTPSYSTTAGTSAGTYSIAVAGLDSTNYEIAFVPGTLTVTISPSTTTLVPSPSSTQYGDPVTLTANVTSGATGTVSFYDGSVLLGTGAVSNGVATLTTTTLTAGTHTVTAVYNGDGTYASSESGPATVTVAKKQGAGGGAALTITVQNSSREYNTADPQFAYIVSGTLVNGDSYAGAVTGAAVYSSTDTATSPAGSTFPISVSGLTSANYQIAVVNGTLTIVSAPTTTTLAASTTSAQYGDPVTLTATVAPTGATGTVLFMQGSTVLGTGTVTNGVATLTTSALNAGAYTITATYEGDANYSASTSTPVTFTITQRTGPGGTAALTVTVADASRAYGQGNPAFSYTITGTLVNGDTYATAITGVPVYSTAAIPNSPAGGYPVSGAGLNSQNYLITVVNGTLTVTKGTPGVAGVVPVTLSSSLNPAHYGNSVTFTASVPAPASGTVQFFEGTTLLGTGTVANGIATLTTSTLAVGTHPVTAAYSGDPDYNSATSAVYGQIVTAQAAVLDFNLTLTSAGTQTVIPGSAAPYTVQVAPTNVTYPGTVTFSATGLPEGATISFSPATVAADGGVTPSSVKVQTAAEKAALKGGSIGSAVLALLMLPLATSRRIRKSSRRYFYVFLLLLGGIGATAGLTGCGYNGNGFFGQAPQSYDITITATSATIQHSVHVKLNVQ